MSLAVFQTLYLQTGSRPVASWDYSLPTRELVIGQKVFVAEKTIGTKAWRHMAFWTTATLKISI